MQNITIPIGTVFNGPTGALVMSLISLSIVFLVCIGLVLIMDATRGIAQMIDRRNANRTPGK
ncbi:MAG: hypothetical protein Q4F74_03355 [Synergistaceae bacterium]|nr:hypothetical protein [Synergistaceae bacterium]